MKNILAFLALSAILSGTLAHASIKGAPFIPEIDSRFNTLEKPASGKIFIGQTTGDASAKAVTGDVTISNAGVTAIGAGKVTEAMLKGPATPLVLGAQRVARFTYDFAVNGGAISAIPLGVTLPAKSIITRSYFYPVTQLTSGGAATIAFSCETANNILTATDETGVAAATITDGASTGATAGFKKITSACNITATIGAFTITAGKWVGWVEYVVAE